MRIIIGIDFDGVIVPHHNNQPRSDAEFYALDPIDGAFESIKELVQWLGRDSVSIISACKRVTEPKTKKWLNDRNFYDYTRFRPANLRFCRTRAEKTPIIKGLGGTHFIDNVAEVLYPMRRVLAVPYLFGPQDDPTQDTTGLVPVLTWAALMADMRR